MMENQKIQYIISPNAEDFPDKDVARLVEELIWSEIKHTSRETRDAMASVLKDISRGPTKQMCEFRNQGRAIIAKDGTRTVGMTGYQEHHRAPTGQRIFEIRRTTVQPDYRGKGIGRGLREHMIEHLREIDHDALLVSRIHSDNTVNQNLAISTQSRLVTSEDMRQLGFAEEYIEGSEQNGYEFYIFDPRNKHALYGV